MHSVIPQKMLWLLPVLSGVLLSLGTITFDVGLFAWVGLVPLLFFLGHPSTVAKTALFGGLIAGTLFGVSVLWPLLSLNAWWWIDPSSFLFLHREILLGIVLVVVAIITGGGFIGLFSYLYWRFHQNNLIDIVVFPMIWMIFERAREVLVVGFTWGHLGYNVHDYTLALQSAKLFGVYSVSGAVVAVNILVYLSLRRINVRNSFIWFLFGFIILLNVSGYLAIREGEHGETNQLRVAVIHSPHKTEVSRSFDRYDEQLAIIVRALEDTPDVVVLPENIFPFFVIDKATLLPQKYEFREVPIGRMYDTLVDLSAQHPDTSFVYGAHTSSADERFNSLIVMERGSISAVYDKQELLPLAESVPVSLTEGHVEPLSKGGSTSVLINDTVTVAPLICSEIIYPRAVSDIRSELIINISNDGVFDSALVAEQNHVIAKLRAAEHGMHLLRSTKEGISSIIDPYGRAVTSTSGGEDSVLTATVYY